MNKIRVKAAPMLYPLPAVMVSLGDEEYSNIITIAWTGIINSNPPMTYISVTKSRHSHDMLVKNKEFVINLVNDKLCNAMDYCGVRSGRNEDKFKALGLTKIPGDEVKAPLIKEAPINLECKVFEIKELPSHDMFMAEIVAVHIDEELIDKNGKYWFEKAGLIAFNHGGYYNIYDRPIGRFGYSIMKNKTKKKLKAKDSR